jgi:hypothetical protein
MRKRLYYFYNILASYPVIVLLLAGFVGLIYLAREHHPLELERQEKNLLRMELKQELNALQQELIGIEQNDLRMRYILFNEEFLTQTDAQAEILKRRFAKTFEVYGWTLQAAKVEQLEIATEQSAASNPKETRVQGIMLDLNASATNQPQTAEEPFLPLYSVTQCLNYLWSRPPIKDYQLIEIVRTKEGYELQARLFLPLKDSDLVDSNELSLNRL